MNATLSFLLGLMLILVPAWTSAQSKESVPVLAIDFIGLNAKDSAQHAGQFTGTVLPEAEVHSIGFHGIIPDSWRKNAGYSKIVRYKTEAERTDAAQAIHGLTTATRTVLAFDFNESIVPQQLRGSMPLPVAELLSNVVRSRPAIELLRHLPNKIQGPASVASEVIVRWLKDHPDGVLVLRGHSDGTYAALLVFDELRRRGIAPHFVVLESRRQTLWEWLARASAALTTTFIEISAQNDLPIATFAKDDLPPTLPENWIRYLVTGPRNSFEAHGVVTHWQSSLELIRTDHLGSVRLTYTTLGTHLKQDFATKITTGPEAALHKRSTASTSTITGAISAAERSHIKAELARLGKGVVFWNKTAKDVAKLLYAFEKTYAKDTTQQSSDDRRGMAVLATFVKVREALEKDIERAEGGHLIRISPDTIEGLAKTGLAIIKRVRDSIPDDGAFGGAGPWADRISGLEKYAAAAGRVAGGQYDPETIKLIVDGTSKLVQRQVLDEAKRELREFYGVNKLEREIAELRVYQQSRADRKLFALFSRTFDKANLRFGQASREIARREALLAKAILKVNLGLAKLSAGLMYFDAIGEFTVAIAYNLQQGHLTIDVADRYSDAAISLAATTIALGVGVLNPLTIPYLPAIREGIVAAARLSRHATEDGSLSASIYGYFFGNPADAMDRYLEYAVNQFRRGERSLPINAFYSRRELQLSGISKFMEEWANDRTSSWNALLKLSGTSTTNTTSGPQPPPVNFSVEEPEKPKHRRLTKLKPRDLSKPLDPPPGRRFEPDVVGGSGPEDQGTKARSSDDSGPCPPGPACPPGDPRGGVTVNPQVTYEPIHANRQSQIRRSMP